jgi:hypothetical protein
LVANQRRACVGRRDEYEKRCENSCRESERAGVLTICFHWAISF